MVIVVFASYKSIKFKSSNKENLYNYYTKYNLYFCKVNKFKVSYKDTELFSKLVMDYLDENKKLKPFISDFPSMENFERKINSKKNYKTNRSLLVDVLKKQNSSISLSVKSKENIDLLISDNTFTITTGHQLCLFTGPLYFIYKIISTINLTEKLKNEYPEIDFVPVFWMAAEDHDFDEVNHIHLFGKKIVWNSHQEGSVGRMNTLGIQSVLDELKQTIGDSENGKQLLDIFEKAYLNNSNLADSTRFLINELFGKYGLVIIDGDDKSLKKEFSPFIKKDILEKANFKSLQYCSDQLSVDYKLQAFVREINFFKISKGKRVRIDGEVSEQEVDNNPEYFSPNVLIRPLYQEFLLPNLAYIGGGAEVSYWMQLKEVFSENKVDFPLLILRNSVMIMEEKEKSKWSDLGFEIQDIFAEEHSLHSRFVQSKSSISFKKEINDLDLLFQSILHKTTDKSLFSSINSEKIKQNKSLQKLEKKLLKSEKQKHENSLSQITKIKKKLFPNSSLQERFNNFIPFYLTYGKKFIETLKEELNPLDTNFLILSLQKNKK